MSFLKWNSAAPSNISDVRNIESVLEEVERATYIADKRKATKDLTVG